MVTGDCTIIVYWNMIATPLCDQPCAPLTSLDLSFI